MSERVVVVVFEHVEGHIVVVVIDGLIDLVVDYNLILFVANMLEDAVVVAAFSFTHEIFAVLHCSKQNAKS